MKNKSGKNRGKCSHIYQKLQKNLRQMPILRTEKLTEFLHLFFFSPIMSFA